MKKIEPMKGILRATPNEGLELCYFKLNELVEAVNTIDEVLSDKICGCGIPFKNHGSGANGYCTSNKKTYYGKGVMDKEDSACGLNHCDHPGCHTLTSSKPSEEGVQGPNAVPSGYGHVDPRDAEAIRADERNNVLKMIADKWGTQALGEEKNDGKGFNPPLRNDRNRELTQITFYI